MAHDVWDVWPDRGFLMNPDPLRCLQDSQHEIPGRDSLEQMASELPTLIATRRLRNILDEFPVFDFSGVSDDCPSLERLMLLYGCFASAYVHMPDPVKRLPASLAVPLVQLGQIVGRPPMMSYASMVLANWKRTNPEGSLDLENLETLQTFTTLPDERWFFLVHVAIEAKAAGLLQGIVDVIQAVEDDDAPRVLDGLRAINRGLIAMLKTFSRMPHGCDPDVYYDQMRPFMFGFTDVIFEGVPACAGKPQSFRGGSGAQSSIVPALVAGLGVQHENSELMQHLEVMKAYMPPAHRHFIERISASQVREYVSDKSYLADAYNTCLRQLMTFRRAHFYYAKTYIFEKSTNPTGTGGTNFIDFLTKLVEETEEHFI
jgi:indoleamine 2,3-dioxygenase